MRRPGRTGSVRPTKAGSPVAPASRRDRLAMRVALVTATCLGSAFFLSQDTQILMPGPLTSAHGAIENCSACHTKSGSGKLAWIHGLVAGNPHADSKACLTCHKMPDTAFNAHGASAEVLKQSTKRLTKIAAGTSAPQWARMQSIAFPTDPLLARGLYCATCHQEHKGVNFSLNKISNEQCHSCHVVKFDNFDGHHPKFENYPFKRRTRIIYDHAGHFAKHFPEVAKKYPARRIPATCSACHNSHEDKRVMAVAPFEQTCTACHLDQIIGKERVSGPKGIAFLTLPGLDLRTLKEKNAPIGEWPDASEAELTPFMKVMIGRNEKGRALLERVDKLSLQDLAAASDDQIKAVTNLVWEIKGLFYALISGKASDVLADVDLGSGTKLSASLVADLTANIPRDVVSSAQQEWLPNLAAEMANPGAASIQSQSDWSTAVTAAASGPPEESEAKREEDPATGPEADVSETGSIPKVDPPVCTMSIFGQCLLSKPAPNKAEAAKKAAQTEGAAGKTEPENAEGDGGAETPSADEQPRPDQPEAAPEKPDTANSKADGGATPSADEPPPTKAADQTDDLLSPTENERREMKVAEEAAKSEEATGGAPADSETAAAGAQSGAPPVLSIGSDVDPESWAENGGWYRQDFAIFYRPTGHKDKFIYSWLFLTGPHAPKGDKSPAAAVFDFLTGKDAQGSCTKCHSVDDIRGKRRVVNFSPLSVESKAGRFTDFIHEPHFQAVGIGQRIGVVENRGCLTCHILEKGRTYLKSYEQGNPQTFASNFGEMNKDLCQSCHNSGTARQDCLLCHKYHVNGVSTPIMNTKIPEQ
jgi:hypothetical protein